MHVPRLDLAGFNTAPAPDLEQALLRCCAAPRWATSGRRPRPAPRLSSMCSTLLVLGITAVTAPFPSRYFRKN